MEVPGLRRYGTAPSCDLTLVEECRVCAPVWQGRGEGFHFVTCPCVLQHWKRLKEFGVGSYLQGALALKCTVAGTFSRFAARNL